MKISVIIPVYNSASFVNQAVSSALSQPETEEIILIEDGSTDNSRSICEGLAKKFEKVRLFQHPERKNLGAGASRNLGMKKAQHSLIAFLDADDYYLPGRFAVTKEIFNQNPECDGVYEAIGRHVEDQVGLERWQASGGTDRLLHTVDKLVPPEKLGLGFIRGEISEFSLDGLTFKKSILNKTGLMNPSLRLHQDTDFIFKLALSSKLFAGRTTEPVAMWRIHDHNRISAPRSKFTKRKAKIKFWVSVFRWCKKYASKEVQIAALKRLLLYVLKTKIFPFFPTRFQNHKLIRTIRLILFLLPRPSIMVDPLVRDFGKSGNLEL